MKKLFLLAIVGMLLLSSFVWRCNDEQLPRPIARTTIVVNGDRIIRTVILFDKSTSREELINTCQFLAHENVQLTFDKLEIGKSYFGIIGRNRIRTAKGNIKLPNCITQNFKAGGLTSFKFIKIQYSNNLKTKVSQVDMIEIID